MIRESFWEVPLLLTLPASSFVDGILLGEVEDVVVDAFDVFEDNREEF